MANGRSIRRRREASREELGGLLLCLDPNPDEAWAEYDLIRRKLIKVFECNRCWPAEEYADEVLDRIAKRTDIKEIRDIGFFAIGVARNVCREHRRNTQRLEYFDDSPAGSDGLADPHDHQRDLVEQIDNEVRLQCLNRCLNEFPTSEGGLVLDYYGAEGVTNHEHRRVLAERIGLTMDSLRVRMSRTREKLERCVGQCLTAHRSRLGSSSESSSSQG